MKITATYECPMCTAIREPKDDAPPEQRFALPFCLGRLMALQGLEPHVGFCEEHGMVLSVIEGGLAAAIKQLATKRTAQPKGSDT